MPSQRQPSFVLGSVLRHFFGSLFGGSTPGGDALRLESAGTSKVVVVYVDPSWLPGLRVSTPDVVNASLCLTRVQVDSHGNLAKGSLASGVICVMIAALVPFDSLDDLISAGVLMAFNFVTSSLLVLRHR